MNTSKRDAAMEINMKTNKQVKQILAQAFSANWEVKTHRINGKFVVKSKPTLINLSRGISWLHRIDFPVISIK